MYSDNIAAAKLESGDESRRYRRIVTGALAVFALLIIGVFGVARWHIQTVCREAQHNAGSASEQMLQWIKQSQGGLLVQQVRLFLSAQILPGEIVDEAAVKGLQERMPNIQSCSLFTSDGRLAFGTNMEKTQVVLPPRIWAELQKSKTSVVVDEQPGLISLYEPLLVDSDAVRTHPDWQLGRCYGYLRVSILHPGARELAAQREAYMAAVSKSLRAIQWQSAIFMIMAIMVFELAGLLVLMASIKHLHPRPSDGAPSQPSENHVQFYAYSDRKTEPAANARNHSDRMLSSSKQGYWSDEKRA